jgi:hypothetical protein
MTLYELSKQIDKAVMNGHGYKKMYAVCGSSGVSYEVSFHPSVRLKNEWDDLGPLCEEEDGYEYMSINLD